MPQKKNPDFAELVRGKTGRVYGSLVSLLTTMKGLALTYNKDMQEDKEGSFDAFDTLVGSLTVVTAMVSTWKVHSEAMRHHAEQGFTNATDAADYLAKKGIPFREAHEVVGKLVRYCVEHNTHLSALPLEVFQRFSAVFEDDIFTALTLETVVNRRESRGGTGASVVAQQISLMTSALEGHAAWAAATRKQIDL
jgi:argininosuccinate lyase